MSPRPSPSSVPRARVRSPSPRGEWARVLLLQARASRAGFDWPDLASVFAKVREELDELEAAVALGTGIEEEYGDLLLVLGRLALALGLEPERALAGARRKFARRYRRYRALAAAEGRDPAVLDAAEIQALWDRVKAEEKGTPDGEDG